MNNIALPLDMPTDLAASDCPSGTAWMPARRVSAM